MLPINEIQYSGQASDHLDFDPISKIDQAAEAPILSVLIGTGRIFKATSNFFTDLGKSAYRGNLADHEFRSFEDTFLRGLRELEPFSGGMWSGVYNSRKAEKYALTRIQADDYNQANLLLNKYGLEGTPENILRSLYSNRDYRRIFLCSIIFDTKNIDGIILEFIMLQFHKKIHPLTPQEKDDYKLIFKRIKSRKYHSGNDINIMLLACKIIRKLKVDVDL